MKVEDAAAVVPFGKMTEAQKEAALVALDTEVRRAGGAPGLVARLAGQLRRGADGSFHLEIDFPRLREFPSSAYVGSGHTAPWFLDLVCKKLPDGHDAAEELWLACEPKILPLAEAVALVADPKQDPIAEMSRRRVEVERRRKARADAAAADREERARAEAADRGWLERNRGRVRRWSELDDLLKALAGAAEQSGDAALQAFVAGVIQLAATRNVSQVRPPSWLWPPSG
jgi:hypothetical protein